MSLIYVYIYIYLCYLLLYVLLFSSRVQFAMAYMTGGFWW